MCYKTAKNCLQSSVCYKTASLSSKREQAQRVPNMHALLLRTALRCYAYYIICTEHALLPCTNYYSTTHYAQYHLANKKSTTTALHATRTTLYACTPAPHSCSAPCKYTVCTNINTPTESASLFALLMETGFPMHCSIQCQRENILLPID